jgi:LemA protein
LSIALAFVAAVLVPLINVSESISSTGKRATLPTINGDGGIAAIIAVAFLAVLGLSWFVRVYNRLVIVRNQARKAWASIEVQEQRRHDLIGSLVTVVKQYAAYEQQLQTAGAAIRAHGPLPTDAEVQAATTQDAGARAQAAQLLAVGEANPELHANAQFTKLHDALTDTENRIAFARQFYNDAVNVMRDRSQTFPYSLFTSLVPMPSLRLFGEGAAPARPAPVGAISS